MASAQAPSSSSAAAPSCKEHQSRWAVESYWRSRMVDGVTADDDKVAPVYKLEEICELLRASDASVVREVADFVLKRLDNKSPLVKQKHTVWLLLNWAASPIAFLDKVKEDFTKNMVVGKQLLQQLAAWSLDQNLKSTCSTVWTTLTRSASLPRHEAVDW